MALSISRPVPGQAYTISTSAAPATTYAREMPKAVSVGRMAFFSTYRRKMVFSLMPVARKVVM